MKKDLNNIDDIFKQAFDGFEADVNPNVWNNVQSSINANVGGVSSTTSSVVSSVTKSIVVKIAAAVIAVGAVATTVYYVSSNIKQDKNAIVENDKSMPISEQEPKNNIEEETLNKEVRVLENNKEEKIAEENSIITETSTSIEILTNDNSANNTNTSSEESENKSTTNSSDQNNSMSTSSETKNELSLESNDEQDSKKDSEVKLKALIKCNTRSGVAPLTVQFDVQGNAVQYFWSFGDGTEISAEESPIHTFFKEGSYVVKLTAQDIYGNTLDKNVTIIVKSNLVSSIEKIPNIISPNGDGRNDVIKISGENIKKIEVFILDRSGNIINEINTAKNEWDGTDKSGNIINQGTYYLSGSILGEDGKTHIVKQAITVYR